MAREATHLLPPVLLVLLASGSWEQKPVPELLHVLEGGAISVICEYSTWRDSNRVKVWCRQASERWCTMEVTSTSLQTVSQQSRYSIWDNHHSGYFIVNVTKLRKEDSGSYWCGSLETSHRSTIYISKIIQLVVSPASTLPMTRSTVRTTVWASSINSDMDSTPGNWKFIIPATVAALLLLLTLIAGVILYLRKARETAKKDDNDSHYVYEDLSAQKEKTTDFDQQMGSEEDTGSILYASLIHLNNFSPEDPIYANTHSNPKLMPDPFLTVEYACITGSRPQPSKSAALDSDPRN
ncbi:uncharacterized protein LOC143684627 [Tamandua tetradactyla]|uniref:uncharacterized protein LOC143684627 n=1 Tax=Tamandua tetradactyla TaxID=48850 RepID=UPI004053E4BC